MSTIEEASPLLLAAASLQSLDAGDLSDNDEANEGFVRACSFEALRGQQFGISMWRRMFHLLDIDGSGDLSCSELRRGLDLLGFGDLVRNPMVLARIFASIDGDNAGSLSEREFLTFFNKFETAEDLRTFISQLTIDTDKMVIHVTSLSQADGKNVVETEDWSLRELPERLEQLRGHTTLTWLDAVGFQEESLRCIGDAYGLSVDTIIQSMILQPPKIEVLRTSTGKSVVKVIVRSLELSDMPFGPAPKQWRQPMKFFYQVFCGPASRVHKDCPEHVASKMLVPKSKVNNYNVAIEQSTLLVLDSHTVITLRCPTRARSPDILGVEATRVGQFFARFRAQLSLHSEYYDFLFAALNKSTHLAHRGEKNLANAVLSPLSNAPVAFATRMCSPKREESNTMAISSLVIVLINCVFSGIYMLRDTLTDWEDVLHEEIHQNGSTMHTHHLSQLKNVVRQTIAEVTAISNTLSPISWHAKEIVESKRQLRIRHARHLRSVVEELLRRPRSSTEELMVTFADNLSEFEELSQDMGNVNTILGHKLEHVRDMTEYLEAVRTDSTNRVLYALALLTAFTVPSGFLTGLFGMNFMDMEELDPASGYGYKLFWIVLGICLVLIILIMNRLDLFGTVLGRR